MPNRLGCIMVGDRVHSFDQPARIGTITRVSGSYADVQWPDGSTTHIKKPALKLEPGQPLRDD